MASGIIPPRLLPLAAAAATLLAALSHSGVAYRAEARSSPSSQFTTQHRPTSHSSSSLRPLNRGDIRRGTTTPPSAGWSSGRIDGRVFAPPSSSSAAALSVRGGGGSASYGTVSDDCSEDAESDLETTDPSESEDEGGSEVEDDEGSDVDVEDDETVSSSSSSSAPPSASGPPVKLSIKTGLSSPLLDQRLEFAASRTRTVLSLKQAISKTMAGRPPLSSTMRLRYHGRVLDDDETIDDILEEMDDDDDEYDGMTDDDDGVDEIGAEEDDAVRVSLSVDIVPPVDAKFGIEFREKVARMSTRELLESYCLNVAGMAYMQELLDEEGAAYDAAEAKAADDIDEGGGDDEEEGEAMELHTSKLKGAMVNHSLNIRRRAAEVRERFESTLSNDLLSRMDEEHERVKGISSSSSSSGSGGVVDVSDEDRAAAFGLHPSPSSSSGGSAALRSRKGRTLKGGAAMNVKRSLQRNLNVNWADTTRNSILFLFFGYFGGRSAFSKTLLILASPLCFVIQTRPVKVAMKQLFYTIGEPPGIFLSLLPAPQQTIMSAEFGRLMRGLYGEGALMEGESVDREWLELEREGTGGDESFGGDFDDDEEEGVDDDYDQYDDDYDSEDEY